MNEDELTNQFEKRGEGSLAEGTTLKRLFTYLRFLYLLKILI